MYQGEKMRHITQAEREYIMQTYPRYPLDIVRAKGVYIWDGKGRRYLDFFSGLAVTNLGHTHPRIVKAIRDQADKYLHVSNLYYDRVQIKLARKLSRLFSGGKVFFSNSGLEANECAIKLSRKIASSRKMAGESGGNYEIIAFRNSFHGRSLATLAATGQEKHRKGYTPLPPGFVHAQYNDLSSVKKLLSKRTCAIIVEPIQGEGGVVVADKKFLRDLRQLADRHGLVLIFDEVQTGMGRTGTLFAFQQFGVKPDILTLAKGLGGGLPLGATIAGKEVSGIFGYGDHGSTFGGNPLSCRAALEVIRFLSEGRLKRIRSLGCYFLHELKKLKKQFPGHIKEVRGMGFMLGLEMVHNGKELVQKCLKKGLVINCTQEKVIRFLPPLIIKRRDIDSAVKIVRQILEKSK